jgi:hypothetical protein
VDDRTNTQNGERAPEPRRDLHVMIPQDLDLEIRLEAARRGVRKSVIVLERLRRGSPGNIE